MQCHVGRLHRHPKPDVDGCEDHEVAPGVGDHVSSSSSIGASEKSPVVRVVTRLPASASLSAMVIDCTARSPIPYAGDVRSVTCTVSSGSARRSLMTRRGTMTVVWSAGVSTKPPGFGVSPPTTPPWPLLELPPLAPPLPPVLAVGGRTVGPV